LKLRNASGAPSSGAPADQLEEAFELLQRAEQLRVRGQLDRARTICEPLVTRFPDYYGALLTLGLIYTGKRLLPQALGCLVRACMLDPGSWKALTALSDVYLELGAEEMAARTLEQARQIKADDPTVHLTLAKIYRSDREYELARNAFRRVFELDPDLPAAGTGLAECAMALGQHEEATEVLKTLIDRGVMSLPAIALLNHLPAARRSLDVLSAIDKIVPEPNSDKAGFENSVAFVRAVALHNAKRYEEAWRELTNANRTMWSRVKDEARDLHETQRANFADLRDNRIKVRRATDAGPQTISLFILGPSRSGKTTMESLVSALPGVKRGCESPAMETAVRRTFQAAGLLTHRMFAVLPSRLDSECREIYLEELARRAGSAAVFTNTHPARIHDAARVAAAIPNVRFIFIKRNLADNMLRIYMQKYAVGHADSYDLKAIRDGLAWYHAMIDLLAAKLPDVSRVITYEEIVADPSDAIRVAADLCGLPIDHGPIPDIGDDRGCAEPYAEFLKPALGA
jgi:tetratricopeptide (TPR) repeat protein